jgi:hypothetical protein
MNAFRFVSFTALACLATFGTAMAQKSPIKIGKMEDAVMKMDYAAKYPGEDAVILADYGYLRFDTDMQHGWVYELERECRIKILNNEGYEWATHSVFIHNNGNVHEKITDIKGYVYNSEGGKISGDKLSKSSIFEEEVTPEITKITFTIPQVREGSIIEFSYKMVSDYIITLPEWKFQKSIPVEHSELFVAIPEDFDYIMLTQGWGRFSEQDKSSRTRSITRYMVVEQNEYGQSKMRETVRSSETCVEQVYHWLAKDQRPLKNERFIGNPADFRLGLEFQLSAYKSGYQVKNFLGTWEQVNHTLLNDTDDFGSNMRPRAFYKEALDEILGTHTAPEAQIAAIHAHVAANMQWNQKFNYMPKDNLKVCYRDQTGSAAEINGLLVSMLRAAGIDADPILISTRGHGLVNPAYPILDKFNYLIAGAWIGDRVVLLDATDRQYPAGMLPERCLNGQGRVISEKRPSWINLQPARGYDVRSMFQMEIGEDGVVSGTASKIYSGYGGLDMIGKMKAKGEDGYRASIEEENPNWVIKNFALEVPEDKIDELREKTELEINGVAQVMGDMMYVDPLLGLAMKENPFKQEDRTLPVDFTYPVNSTEVIRIAVPEGYVVEEVPEPIVANLPDKSICYKFLIQNMGSAIQISHQLDQNKSFYLPGEYKALRELFALIVAKEGEQVVLKKSGAN